MDILAGFPQAATAKELSLKNMEPDLKLHYLKIVRRDILAAIELGAFTCMASHPPNSCAEEVVHFFKQMGYNVIPNPMAPMTSWLIKWN